MDGCNEENIQDILERKAIGSRRIRVQSNILRAGSIATLQINSMMN